MNEIKNYTKIRFERRNEVMKNIVYWSKVIVYTVLGIIILIFQNNLLNYLKFFVAIPTLALSIEEFVFFVIEKNYTKEMNDFGSIVIKIVLSIVLLFVDYEEIIIICVLWGIMVIITATTDLSKAVHLFIENYRIASVLEAIQSIVQIFLSVLLIIDPIEHVSLHIIVLGIEMLLLALKSVIKYIYNNVIEKRNKERLA